jgi:RNA polymerase sigma-70 factor (ECF subfamily)
VVTKSPIHPSADVRAKRFEAIFRKNYPQVLAFALRRSTDRDAAEEVAAETFLIAWRRFEVISHEPLPWLLSTARNVLANQRRSSRRRDAFGPRLALDSVDPPDLGTSIPEQVADREAFAKAFLNLRLRDREVLALSAWEGLSPREAGLVMDCSAATFSLRLHRARGRLLKKLAAGGHSLGGIADQPSTDVDVSEAR